MNEIVNEAKSWLGTPYHHQASMKGVGCDCLGLVRGVWRFVKGDEPEIMPAYTKEWAEVHGAERLLEAARRHLVERNNLLPTCGGAGTQSVTEGGNFKKTPPPTPPARGGELSCGDVLLFRMRPTAVVKHAGIFIGDTKFIHAYEHAGVVEAEFNEFWQKKLAAVFGWG